MSRMEVDRVSQEKQTPAPGSAKRKVEQTLVDPDTGTEIPNCKRSKVSLDDDKKVKCLRALLRAFQELLNAVSTDDYPFEELLMNVNVSHQITSVIFTCHNVKRQSQTTPSSNMMEKAAIRDYQITYM